MTDLGIGLLSATLLLVSVIGVLWVLSEHMGALVGGGYASGMTAGQIEQFVSNVDWKLVVAGVGSRHLVPAEEKRFNDTSGSVELGLKDGRIIPPSGLVASSRIEDVLRSYVAKARAVSDFDRLPIPYRAVATDMMSVSSPRSGAAVWSID